jgi:hypothetical protein
MNKKTIIGLSLLITFFCCPLAIAGSEDSEEVADEIYLLVRGSELLGFSSVGSNWVSQDLEAREQVLASKYGGHVAVVFTNIRILGFSALTSKWSAEKLRPEEELVNIEATGNVGAVVTNLRAFGFSAKTGNWVVRRLGIE